VNQRGSLRLRLTLAALVPMLLAMLAAWVIATVAFTRTLEQRVESQIGNAANVITGNGLPLTTDLLQRVADLQQAEIALLGPDGAVIASTRGNLSAFAAGEISRQPVAARGAETTLHLDVAGEPAIAIVRQLAERSDPRASAMLITASLRDARDAARRAALGMGLAVLAAGALLVLLQYMLVRSITEPISGLVAMANQIASGKRNVHAGAAPHGELQALSTALNDMTTKLQVYETELAERSRLAALGEMSARIAHEIRNPLTGLKLHLQLLDERATPADRPTLRRLLDEVGRLELIVASSLSLNRPQPAVLREADVGGAVDEVLALMEPSLRHRGIELTRSLGPTPPVAIDRDRIKQAVLNLVVNASDALPAGGSVLAACLHDTARGLVTISIEDSGPGIDPASGAGSDGVTGSSKPFGLGLGLRVCREIVAEHGGRLVLGRSASLGGAAATIELPVRAAS
jgi:signal transduction histidine kinase